MCRSLLVFCSIRAYLCSRGSSNDVWLGRPDDIPDIAILETLEGLAGHSPGGDRGGKVAKQVDQPDQVESGLPDNIFKAKPSIPTNKAGQAFRKSLSKWKEKNEKIENIPAPSVSALKTALGAATRYLDHPDFPDRDRHFFADDYNPTMEAAVWPETPDWARYLTSRMLDLPPGVDTDDHSGTPIGAGETIALVAAIVQMDARSLDNALPESFRTGLFAHCEGPCPKWVGALRVSHTQASDTDLMRIALKIDTGEDSVGEMDLHFTETMRSFPIGNKNGLEGFIYSLEHGASAAVRKYPKRMMKMAFSVKKAGWLFQDEVKQYGVGGKNFYSLTAYKIGGENGRAASAMKWRLVPRDKEGSRRQSEEGEDVKQVLREQFCRQVSTYGLAFDIEIQVASNPKKHPVNDVSVEWDVEGAPWVKVASLSIPMQGFRKKIRGMVGHEAVSMAIVSEDGITPRFNSKELVFEPQGTGPHIPLGDVNAFRSFFYPLYDQERQEHLLGKKGGLAAQCPWAVMRSSLL